MAGRVLLVLIRTLIGVALIAGGVVIWFLQYKPGLMPSVATGDGIVGPLLSLIGVNVTFWPVVTSFYRAMEKWRAESGEPSKPEKVTKAHD